VVVGLPVVASVAARAKRASPAWAKDSAAPTFRAWGRLTARHRPLPDFLIVGVKRGGTTTLLKYLQRHPGVLPMWPAVQNSKKTWFFDDNYGRGSAWYRGFFATEATFDRVGDELGYRPVTGEAAPYYLFHPLVADRVAETLPGARIVVLLRNPVDRAYSHWNERRNAGVERLSFGEALAAEPGRLAGQTERLRAGAVARSAPHDWFSYLARGDYEPQLRRWTAALAADQVLVLRSEDLYAQPAATLSVVHAFLGLPKTDPPDAHRYNQLPVAPLGPALRRRLAAHFEPKVEAVESMLGRSLGWDLAAGGLRAKDQ
jgi:Sulfotransferase domain